MASRPPLQDRAHVDITHGEVLEGHRLAHRADERYDHLAALE